MHERTEKKEQESISSCPHDLHSTSLVFLELPPLLKFGRNFSILSRFRNIYQTPRILLSCLSLIKEKEEEKEEENERIPNTTSPSNVT